MATIEISRRVDTLEDGRFRLRLWVSKTSNNIEPEIFVYQDLPPVPKSIIPDSKFVHIATYEAMLTVPADAVEADGTVFFRLRQIDLTFIALEKLEVEFLRMEKHIQALIEDIVRLNKLPPAEVKIIDVN